MKPKLVCVTPTIRPESMTKFREAWHYLFDKHEVSLITVWDGERPRITYSPGCSATEMDITHTPLLEKVWTDDRDLFCRFTDACRNLGFIAAAAMGADYILTLDDDVAPVSFCDCPSGYWKDNWDDPIEAHLNALSKKVSTSWMSTAHDTELHLRGEPYSTREESPVMLSHGVWVGTPDFDGETQLRLEGWEDTGKGLAKRVDQDKYMLQDGTPKPHQGVPYTLPYYVGPIPRGVLAAICGMNLMVRKEALPYLYFAPMGPDSDITERCSRCGGYGLANWGHTRTSGASDITPCPKCKGTGATPNLHRFADIWMGLWVQSMFAKKGWAVYTGASTILHTRVSDAKKNCEQEKLGREWNELMWRLENGEELQVPNDLVNYRKSWIDKRQRFAELITDILGNSDASKRTVR